MITEINLKTGKEKTRDWTDEEVQKHNDGLSADSAQDRINELKSFLKETDYIALSDYDKEKPDVVSQRKSWRQELRELES